MYLEGLHADTLLLFLASFAKAMQAFQILIFSFETTGLKSRLTFLYELKVCKAYINNSTNGTVKTLPTAFSLIDHEFIWTWPLIGFCQPLGGE